MDLTHQRRKQIWNYLIAVLEEYYDNSSDLRVSPELDKEKITAFIQKHHSKKDVTPEEAISHVIEGLQKFSVHTPHPRYFGLFNPRPAFAGILADTITATFNPQMAAWSHSPFAAETEIYLLREFGKRFGYNESEIDGNFTSGGQEANLTAMLCALNHCFPAFNSEGLRNLSGQPLIYCSGESHHSILKSATITGLGMNAVRNIETDAKHRMDPEKLESRIKDDIRNGHQPFMIVSSLGTTGTGSLDPVEEISWISEKYHCWLHADAAYGGAVILNHSYADLMKGIQRADSITFDAHKWLSVPMSAGMFITRHPSILHKTFRINADYMPKDAGKLDIVDPFSHSIQWSRRFIGLKVYLSLLIYGWEGWSKLVDEQIQKGEYLKKQLKAGNWIIFNDTPLPVVCFGKKEFESDDSQAFTIAQKVISTGKAWISVYRINSINSLRACLTNYQTNEKDMDELVNTLNQVYAGMI